VQQQATQTAVVGVTVEVAQELVCRIETPTGDQVVNLFKYRCIRCHAGVTLSSGLIDDMQKTSQLPHPDHCGRISADAAILQTE
jgi:predicted  nucleic acid-binding Zn-ribbon protein